METWVDVRVPRDQYGEALKILLSAQHGRPLTLAVDLDPPAAGPEVEVSVRDVPEDDVRALLDLAGVFPMALRTRPVERIVVSV